jgi:peptidoglycan hydrolase-like protein with peptidoglycan-binding domain
MTKLEKFGLSLTALFILLFATVTASAQTNPGEQSSNPTLPATLRITEKEVIAVQVALYERGYLLPKPTGVLDRDTREALRAYQQENGLNVNGRIDQATYEHLDLTYPATGREIENLRRQGLLPRIGHGVKDVTVATGKAVSSAPGKVKAGAQAGVDKTREAGNAALTKSKEAAGNLGETTKDGARSLGRATQRAGGTLVGRSDADVQKDVRALLAEDEQTRNWIADVKQGRVSLRTPPQHNTDVGKVVSSIRQIPGVKSVFVIAQ